ncbi:MAG TPA: DUF5668 domain-containing protein [Candidatus Aquicultor sp.]|jgi:hypothetical protein
MSFGRFINLVIALVLIVAGAVLLLSNLGYISVNPFTLIFEFWPLVLVVLGLYFLWLRFRPMPRFTSSNLAEPLGSATRADVTVDFGAGELTIDPLGESDKLIDGSFRYQPSLSVGKQGTTTRVKLGHAEWPWFSVFPSAADNWRIGLTTRIPLNVCINTGASRVFADLSSNIVENIELHTGASDVTLRLPQHGSTRVRIEAGAASIRVEVPQGVSARIISKSALSSLDVDQRRFPPAAAGYASPDYDTAQDKADIEVSTGMASVNIV